MKLSKHLSAFVLAVTLIGTPVSMAQFNFGSLLDKVKSTAQNLTSTSSFQATDLVGNWKYVSPAVSMKGDNILANIGSAAGASTIEDKLSPYYQKIGLQKSTLDVAEDMTFTFTLGAVKLTGTIEKAKDTDLTFHFKAFGKVSIGSVSCMATKSGNTVNLTFDAQKLLSLLQTISSKTSNSSIKSINAILSNYKDLYLGMKMTRQ